MPVKIETGTSHVPSGHGRTGTYGPPDPHAPPISITSRMPRNNTVRLAATTATPTNVSTSRRAIAGLRTSADPGERTGAVQGRRGDVPGNERSAYRVLDQASPALGTYTSARQSPSERSSTRRRPTAEYAASTEGT